MSGPSTSRPSSKGYAPVPVEERIDDGVEEPQEEQEAEDDEGLYNTSAPLLSSRSRGNEPPQSKKLCWYHKIGNWKPFRHDEPYDASWHPPSKNCRNWPRIFLFTFIGTLVAATFSLSISTGVLANQLRSRRSHSCRGYYTPSYYNTRLPLNEGWRSSNNRLNFAKLYPPLDASSSSACKAAFNTLTYVPCHEKIWNRSWDNGKHRSLFDPDISLYSRTMCASSCTEAINRAFKLIASQCTEEDKFDMTDYYGPFLADEGLENSPIGVISTIAQRLIHTCRTEPTPPSRYYYSADYCTSIMWDDWFIVDGMNAGNLEGLSTFEARTRIPRSEGAGYKYQNSLDKCDDLPTWYGGRRTEARRYGPSVNSTTCDWCTMNWFERKLLSWKKDEITDPGNGKTVGLPEYLRRIQNAGQRCDADAWDRVWGRALTKYKQSGELTDDWEKDGKDEGSKKPSKPNKPSKPGKGKKPCPEDETDGFVHILPVIPQTSE